MLTYRLGSTGNLTATLQNTAGAAVTGATVTLSIFAVVNGVERVVDTGCDELVMVGAGGGTYTATIDPDWIEEPGLYLARISGTKAGEEVQLEIAILAVRPA